MKHVFLAGAFALASTAASAATCAQNGVTVDSFDPATDWTCNISGNDTGGGSTFLADLNAGSIFTGYGMADIMETWSLLGKSDDGDPDVTADNGAGDGVWSADGVGEYIVVTLKSGSEFSAYLFTGLTSSDITGTFDTFLANIPNGSGRDGRDLSHLSVFTAGDIGDPSPVPIPAAGLMLLTALGGAAALRRKG